MLLEKIEKEISAKNAEKELRIKKENELFQKEIDKLTPLLKDLEILKQYGLNPTLHTDKNRVEAYRKNIDGSVLYIACRSKAKLTWMQQRLERSGFTSFWP